VYTSTLANYAGSGISASVAGTTIATTPTTAGVYPFTVTATDGICTNVSTMTLTVNALPVITTATALPTTACHNAVVDLTASSIVSGPQTLPAGYCATNNSGGTGTFVNNVLFGTIANNSATTNPVAAPYYTNYTATTNVQPGQTYPLSITTGPAGTYTGAIISVWVDFNRDGVLAATEWQQVALNQAAGTTSITNITIPLTAQMGLTKMRIRTRGNGNPNGSGDACSSMGSGETEDYLITIAPVPACPAPSQLSVVTTTTTSADLSWNLGCSSASNYDFEYGPVGFTQGTGTLVSNVAATVNTGIGTYTLTGLTPNTTYSIYYRANCGNGDVSPWSVAVNGTTACNPITLNNPGNQTVCVGQTTTAISFSGTAGATFNWINNNTVGS
jgi:hypothetical protein